MASRNHVGAIITPCRDSDDRGRLVRLDDEWIVKLIASALRTLKVP
jgi:hypothetical protein